MEKIIFSKHMLQDRTDRYVFIATQLGFGEIIFTKPHQTSAGAGTFNITSTGVIMIMGYNNTVITMYIGSAEQIRAAYGKNQIPRELVHQIRRNEKRNFILLQDKKGR